MRKSRIAYILYIYTSTYILIRKSLMSFFNVFCFSESVLVYDINNVHLNKSLFLYLVGISFLEQIIFSFYHLLKSWYFQLMRFGQNRDDMLQSTAVYHTVNTTEPAVLWFISYLSVQGFSDGSSNTGFSYSWRSMET